MKVKDINGHIRFIFVGEIEYAEASGHYTIVFTITEKIIIKMTWKTFLDMIDNKFIRVHRSYVVQRSYIKLIKSNEILLLSGKSVPVSRQCYKELEKKITTEF